MFTPIQVAIHDRTNERQVITGVKGRWSKYSSPVYKMKIEENDNWDSELAKFFEPRDYIERARQYRQLSS